MHKHKVAQTVAAVTRAQSILSNALKMAEMEHGPANTWDISSSDGQTGQKKLADILFPYLKIRKICGSAHGCFASNYKTLQGTNYRTGSQAENGPYYKAKLEDGTSILVYSNGSGCPSNHCGSINIDINGTNPPNIAGIDYFSFYFIPNRLEPSEDNLELCNHSSTHERNGIYCAKWVILKKNMDYTFRDISWDE